jgi:hypothetical protein
MKHLTYIFLFAVVLFSCDEPTELDLRQTPPKIVIEGLLTNKPGYQSVKISRSTDFYATGETPRVMNANVMVTDDTGAAYPYVHNPRNHPDSMGVYLPQAAFTGEPGKTYTLHVDVDGDAYEASDKLFPVIPIDDLKFQINEDQEEDPEEAGKIYELLLYAREPQDEDNFYLFNYYRNDSLIRFNPTDIYYSNDELIAENIEGIPSPVYYGANDSARLEVFSLTRNGYIYYNDLWSILNNDNGGMFGPRSARCRRNKFILNDASVVTLLK